MKVKMEKQWNLFLWKLWNCAPIIEAYGMSVLREWEVNQCVCCLPSSGLSFVFSGFLVFFFGSCVYSTVPNWVWYVCVCVCLAFVLCAHWGEYKLIASVCFFFFFSLSFKYGVVVYLSVLCVGWLQLLVNFLFLLSFALMLVTAVSQCKCALDHIVARYAYYKLILALMYI